MADPSRRVRMATVLILGSLVSCGSTEQDLVDQLAIPSRREAARLELLLAKDRAVAPLLEALGDPERSTSRPELVIVLVGLLARVGDERITTALTDHLRTDPDAQVRSAIARTVGLHRRIEFVEVLLASGLSDTDPAVLHQSLLALTSLATWMTSEQEEYLVAAATRLVTHQHVGVATEARIIAEARVAELVDLGRARHVQAEVAEAESLYWEAVRLVPDNKYANYRLARLRYDEGDRERGLAALRDHGMLLDVPHFNAVPVIDGRLEDGVWAAAAAAAQFYSYVGTHKAGIPASVKTELFLGYTDEALYIGFVGHDEHPDSLVAYYVERDRFLWHEDIVEIYLDADLDHQSYVHMGVNSLGTIADAWHPDGLGGQDQDWNADVEIGAHVGDASWSLEVALRFREPRLPRPTPGTVWGFNFVRTHRGAEFAQWVRTYAATGGHTPDDFGFLVFRQDRQ